MTVCTVDGCARDVRHVRRGLCHPCYQAAHKAGTLPPLPPIPSPPHDCARGHQPSATCYVGCACRCRGCRDARANLENRRRRNEAYGRPHRYVDAQPARDHVRSLMAPRVGSTRGMGHRRIADAAGVSHGSVSRLLYGDYRRGTPPSRRVTRDTAARLLAVTLDPADGATVPAGPTRRRLDRLVEAGFTRRELARYLTGNPDANGLQIASSSTVTVAHERAVDGLYRRWRGQEIVPRGRCRPGDPAARATTPLDVTPPGEACVECGAPPLGGGFRCWPCYRAAIRQGAA